MTFEFDAEDYQKYNNGNAFELEMVAKGAGSNPLESETTTTIGTNLNIKGINVRMLGVTMAAGKAVTVENAKLEYYGTKQDDDLIVHIKGDESEAAIYTGAGDDSVQLTAEGGTLALDTGDGADDVEVVFSGKTAAIDTGAGKDSVQLTASGAESVTLEGDSASASMDIDTGSGNDEVKLSDLAAAGQATITTGEGSDTVQVDLDTAGNGVTVDTGAGDDSVALTNQIWKNQTPAEGSVKVTLGEGNDSASVQMLVADTTKLVELDGGEGEDALHISGRLNENVAADKRATGTERKAQRKPLTRSPAAPTPRSPM